MTEFPPLNFAQISRCFWERVEQEDEGVEEVFSRMKALGSGSASIPGYIARLLYCLTRYYQPRTVCEIGTYRGRSATAMALGMESGVIWTCDSENDWIVPKPKPTVEIRQHKKQTSTAMLAEMKEPIDLFFFDGRIQRDDVAHIRRLTHDQTVYAFDDFEGIEKGVVNALTILTDQHILITGNGRLAVAAPSHIRITRQ